MKRLVLLCLGVSAFVRLFAAPSVSYVVSFPEPYTHYAEVSMRVEGYEGKELKVKMPVWAPGSYLVREFAKNVEDLRVTVQGSPVAFQKADKNTWTIKPSGKGTIDISYKVYANELSVRTSFVNDQHAYLNGSSVFLYVDGLKDLPLKLSVKPFKDWKMISTGMRSGADKWELQADNYDQLADSPLEIGNHKVFDFMAGGTLHHVAMFGEGNYNIDSLKKDMARVTEACIKVFDDAPNKEYTFIIHNITIPSGGLEHMNSTTLQVNRWTYAPRSSYKQFLGLVAHEYFHQWNVKRLRPVQLGPFDYDHENYTTLLWEMEGVTSYYEEKILRKCGITSEKDFLESLADNITALENQPGSKVQSAAEASFDAWIKQYRPNENSYNSTISYYSKGSVLGSMLDLEIMSATGGSKSYDDVLRYLYSSFYRNGNKGITESDLLKAVETVAGKPMEQFFKDYVYSTRPVNYTQELGYAGLDLKNVNPDSTKALLGAILSEKEGRLTVKTVIRGTSAYDGGLNVDDEILAVNGFRVNNDKLSKLLSYKAPGDRISVLVSRDDVLKTLEIELKRNTSLKYKISKKEKPDPGQEKVYKKWLSAQS